MENLIPITNKLQEIFSSIGTHPYQLNLPQIVVVGSQSSGKSSVLESIVGKDFIPRGSGVCTRRPLILQLVNRKEATEDHGEFIHMPGKIYTEYSEIKNEIIRETRRETGDNGGISDRPIGLKLFSENFIDLSLVDLPGITKIATGDQPTDIEKKVRTLVKSYISNQNSFILAVIPGNADLATSDALQIAKEMDPLSERTLGVLTKVDIMDKGQSVKDVLEGKVFPLKHGYIAVKNRSQIETKRGVTIDEALDNERIYFSTHKDYKNLAERNGVPFLVKRLNKILVEHIKQSLPKLRFNVKRIIAEVERVLDKNGVNIDGSVTSMSEVLLSAISKFCKNFTDAIEGKGKSAIIIKELYGGAKISDIFCNVFKEKVKEIGPFDGLLDEDISVAIQNATGTKPALFVPEKSFETLSKRQIVKLREPSLECVELVFRELLRVSRNCCSKGLKKFPKLKERIQNCVEDVLCANKEPALKMVHCLLEIELAYINTNHPDFIGGSSAVSRVMKTIDLEKKSKEKKVNSVKKSNLNGVLVPNGQTPIKEDSNFNRVIINPSSIEKRQIEIEIIKSLMSSYFKIVQKNVLDNVPKTVMHFLVNRSKEELQSSLVSALYKKELFKELLEEDKEAARERKRCREMLVVLRNALEVIESVKDFDAMDN